MLLEVGGEDGVASLGEFGELLRIAVGLAGGALDDLTYDIRWFEFPAAAPLAEALNAGAVDAGIIGDAPLLF
ncbi:hypothetical protein CJT53_32140, partial [Pseudomonas aeruginosa]